MTSYPLQDHARSAVRTNTGKALNDITLEALRRGELQPADLAIHPQTLREQARIALEHGYPQLAANLRRAAELAMLPESRVIAIYEALRPYRTSAEMLETLAIELEQRWQAPENAQLLREAAAAYKAKQLV